MAKTFDIEDDRLAEYADAVAENIGYLKNATGKPDAIGHIESEGHEVERHGTHNRDYAGMQGGQEMQVFSYERFDGDGVAYGVQWSQRVAIDDVIFKAYLFDHEPSKDDIRTVELLEQVVTKARRGEISTEFTCWECGNETHIIDAAGSSEDNLPKLRRMVDVGDQKYCHEC